MKKIGRYDVISELGRGAMGVVYRASDPTIGREVALKVLSLNAPSEGGTSSPQQMFMREIRAAGRLAHPSIVAIHDAFDDQENQTSCIVMELVPGVTLEKILDAGHPLTIEQSLNLVRQIAEGLDYAHRNQVIHRDLKPANILVTQDGRAKITDFGIAKVLAREGMARTVGVMGTPSYMSPEQVRGGEVDGRTDIFSLGIMIFTMLSGKKPFSGNTAAVMFKIVYEEPPAPSSLNPQLTPAHDYLVKKCLAKDRNLRYASASELLGDLDDLQHDRPLRSQAAAPAPAPAPRGPAAAPRLDKAPAAAIPSFAKLAPQQPAPPKPPWTPPPRVAAQHPKPVAPAPVPPPRPLKGQIPPMRIPDFSAMKPSVPPSRPAAPLPSLSNEPTLIERTLPMPAPDLDAVSPQAPPSPRPAPVPPAPPEPSWMNRTIAQPVPDLSAVSPQAPSSPRATPVPPVPPESPWMERALTQPAPDLDAVFSQPPPSPRTVPAPPAPPESPWMNRTVAQPVPDLDAESPPAPPWPRAAPAPPAAPDYPPMETPLPVEATALSPSFPEAEPQPDTFEGPLPPDAALGMETAQPPVEELPAPKSKVLPIMWGGVAVVLLAVAVGAYWKVHRSGVAPAPPPQVVVQTPPVAPPPTPAESPTPPPAAAPEQPTPPGSAPAEAAKKPTVHKPKQTNTLHPSSPVSAPPTAQPEPATVTPLPQPSPPTPSPEDIARAEAARVAKIPRIIQVLCNYGLKEATFVFSTGGKPLFEEALKGKKKKGGFLGIKGSYQGTFTHTLTVPAGASELSVRVLAKDGATDLTKAIQMPAPGGFVPTLTVEVDSDHLALNWQSSAPAQ
jgi:serine/threonine protein kinase